MPRRFSSIVGSTVGSILMLLLTVSSVRAQDDANADTSDPSAIELGAPPVDAEVQADVDVEADVDAAVESSDGLFHAYSLVFGVQSAGPLLFRDTADYKLDPIVVFQYGAHLAFVTGDELTDTHRFGLGLEFDRVASSPSRALNFFTPYLTYQTGHPLVFHVQLGGTIAAGGGRMAGNYSGVYTAIALGYSFLGDSHASAISVTPSLVGRSTIAVKDIDYSSFFLGAQVEIAYKLK